MSTLHVYIRIAPALRVVVVVVVGGVVVEYIIILMIIIVELLELVQLQMCPTVQLESSFFQKLYFHTIK